jgi:hypothetical protein
MKRSKERDPRFRALVPQLEALPSELRDALVALLEGAVQVHQLIELDRKRRRKMRPGEASEEND